jgi:hypothetical protein
LPFGVLGLAVWGQLADQLPELAIGSSQGLGTDPLGQDAGAKKVQFASNLLFIVLRR